MAQGSAIMKGMMQQRMKMDCMSQMMRNDNSLAMVMPEKGPLVKNEKRPGMSKCGMNKGIVFKAE
jgi:hypothetical protein